MNIETDQLPSHATFLNNIKYEEHKRYSFEVSAWNIVESKFPIHRL